MERRMRNIQVSLIIARGLAQWMLEEQREADTLRNVRRRLENMQ